MKGKVLITGANGFIGSFLVREASHQGYSVYAAVRKNADLSNLENLECQILKLDYDDEEEVRGILQKYSFDYYIINAGVTHSKSSEELYKVNAAYPLKMCKLITEEEVVPKKLVYISSLSAFGPADLQPSGIVDQNSYPHPLSEYGKSKLQAEQFLRSASNIPTLIFRPSVVYGPYEKHIITLVKMVKKGYSVGFGKEDQYLSFIYVKDLVQLLVGSLDSPKSNKEYFVSDGELYKASTFRQIVAHELKVKPRDIRLPKSMLPFAAQISEWIGAIKGTYPIFNKEKLSEIKAASWNCDISRTKKHFNWEPSYSLEQGLKETIEWYKMKGWI